MTIITITSGLWSADVAPSIGGGLASLRHGTSDIFRPATPEALRTANPLGLSSFPMLPYPGRIRKGSFAQNGHVVSVPPNHPNFPYPLHGDGWLAQWDVVDHLLRPDSCTIRYIHEAGGWPWDYVADLTYRLSDDGLTMTLGVCNQSGTSMPLGMGQHPYFERGEGCRLTLQVDQVLWPAEDLVADHAGAVPSEWDFASGHDVGSTFLDHGFSGWRGATEMTRDDFPFRIRMSASTNAGFLQIYAPEDATFVCVEPMTCMANALNQNSVGQKSLGENGLLHLAPGETAVLDTHVTIHPR